MANNKPPPMAVQSLWRGRLMANGRTIAPATCLQCPISQMPEDLHFEAHYSTAALCPPEGRPHFSVSILSSASGPAKEWIQFLTFLYTHDRVGTVRIPGWKLQFQPPNHIPVEPEPICVYYEPRPLQASPTMSSRSNVTHNKTVERHSMRADVPHSPAQNRPVHETLRVHPAFLDSLEQTHAAWIFGGLAELIDNSRDALATRLDISVAQMAIFKNSQKDRIPVLQVCDNGCGMSHQDIVRMLSLGHKRPGVDDVDQIGCFGVGFKTGAMRIGSDAVVFTKGKETCSLGFLSKSYNQGLDVLEVPIVTYQVSDDGSTMDLDDKHFSRAQEEACKKAVKEHSPFRSDIMIGAQFAKIGARGTSIYVYNLEQWEGKCIFDWSNGAEQEDRNKNDGEIADIQIRSKRVRNRPGQTSRKVPLDYSLRAYLEVLFLNPRMTIYLQGTRVKTLRLAESLHKTQRFQFPFVSESGPRKAEKMIELTLGFRQEEYNLGNCGVFLYWHGRLIEAYKRVGGMTRSADVGRGIIGVMDVTEAMDFGNGKVGVLNSKQGFTDSDTYVKLEKWLGDMFNAYWDENFDNLETMDKNTKLQPDHQWVQCDSCLKWRVLPDGWNSDEMEGDWFCYMEPYCGSCNDAEVMPGNDVFTIEVKRGGGILHPPHGNGSDVSMVANGDNFVDNSSSSDEVRVARKRRRPPVQGKPIPVPLQNRKLSPIVKKKKVASKEKEKGKK
ncbi:unnamed protein product [Sphagnum balticum]